MAPVYLNPPSSPFSLTTDQIKDDQAQLFISPNQPSSSISCPSNFFNTSQDQGPDHGRIRDSLFHDQEADKPILCGKSSNHVCSSTSTQPEVIFKAAEDENGSSGNDTKEYQSAKWMSSKMRLVRKMIIKEDMAHKQQWEFVPNLQNQRHQYHLEMARSNNNSNIVRVCADCNTTTTPLWRSGPRGPKSLCNACGIRQRKARRAMAEAAASGNGVVVTADSNTAISSPPKINRVHGKEKKCRTNHFGQFKSKSKPSIIGNASSSASAGGSSQLSSFKDFALSTLSNNSAFQQVFPVHDDVAEAAVLLMELSCGFVHI